MAYVDTGILEDEELNPQVPGSGASVQQPTSNAMASGASNVQKTPGKFANITEYLRVNAPQQFGSQVAGKIGEEIQQGEQNLASAQDQFKSRVDDATITDTQGLIPKVSQSPQQIGVEEFAKLRDANYQGPSSLSDTRDLYSQAMSAPSSAIAKADASKTEGGRFSLLDTYFGKPSYNQGQKSLDNLLIQNDPNARQSFDQMRENAQNLRSQTDQVAQNLSQYAGQARGTTEATRDAARGAVSGAFGDLSSSLDTRLGESKASQQERFKILNDALMSKNLSSLSEADKALLGANQWNEGAQYVDATKFLSPVDLSREGLTSADEASRLRALAQLGAMEDPFGDSQEFGSQIGKESLNFDIDKFLAEMNFQKNIRDALNTPKPSQKQNELTKARESLDPSGDLYFRLNAGNPVASRTQFLAPYAEFMGGKSVDQFVRDSLGTDIIDVVDSLLANANNIRMQPIQPGSGNAYTRAQGIRF